MKLTETLEPLLLLSIIVLVIGFSGLSLSNTIFFSASNDKTIPLPEYTPQNYTTVYFQTNEALNFLAPTTGNTVIFDVNGSYTADKTSWIKITDTKDMVIERHPLCINSSKCFPVRITLPEEGQFIAIFENVNLTNESTFITAYSPDIDAIQQFSSLSLVSGGITIFGLTMFIFTWGLLLFQRDNEIGIKPKRNEIMPTRNTLTVFTMCIIALLLILFFVLPSTLLHWNLSPSMSILVEVISLGLIIAYAISGGLIITKKGTMSYEKIVTLDRIGLYAFLILSIGVMITAVLSILTIATHSWSLLYFGIDIYVIAFCVFLVCSPFMQILSKDGRMTFPLRKFSDAYKRNKQDAEFQLLAPSCRRIANIYKGKNIAISNKSLTIGLSYSILSKNNTKDVDSLIYLLELQEPANNRMIRLLKKLTADGNELETKGIKAPPTFLERYKFLTGLIGIIITTVIGTALTLLLQYWITVNPLH